MSDLDTLLMADDDAVDLTTPGDPIVKDWEAERALSRIAYLRNELAEAEQLAKARMEIITSWVEGERRRLEGKITWWSDRLVGALVEKQKQDEAEGRKPRKSLALPNGRVQSRTTSKLEFTDPQRDAGVAGWAMQHLPDVVKVEHKLDKTALKNLTATGPDGKLVTPDGELVPGVELVESTSYTVKTS